MRLLLKRQYIIVNLFLLSAEVSEYCKSRISLGYPSPPPGGPVLGAQVTSTTPSVQESQDPPSLSALTPPTIFRPPGMGDSDTETEATVDPEDAAVEDVKPDLRSFGGLPPVPSSYPGMLRLMHPHMYRHYHPYLHIHNLHPYFSSLYGQK